MNNLVALLRGIEIYTRLSFMISLAMDINCVEILLFKVAYNSGMFDNSHLLIMQYFFSNDL